MAVRPAEGDGLRWRALLAGGTVWGEVNFGAEELGQFAGGMVKEDFRNRLLQLFAAAEELRSGCTERLRGWEVTTQLEFDRHWGLGSSSTLIAALAEYLDVNPYALLERTFGGSGYDLACATAGGPIVYERNGTEPRIRELEWRPAWTEQTYFVYRNQKQNSREGIRAYRSRPVAPARRDAVAELTTALLDPTLHPRAVAKIFQEHERLIGDTLGLTPVQEELFSGFPGTIKSLGAWGGDFVWVLSEEGPKKVRAYFNERSFPTVVPYAEMVLR